MANGRTTYDARLMFEPEARPALIRGFNRLAATLETALGPRGRLVVMARDNRLRTPELLNDGAVIARRFTGFPNRFETMGAFVARHIAWQMEEAVGDGSTTAVILARRIIAETQRLAAAGHNVMALRRGLERAAACVVHTLGEMAKPLEKPPQIAALARAITGDETIGELVADVFDVVGPYGAVDVRRSYSREHTRRFINGTFWNQGWFSSHFTTEGGTAVVKEPYLLLTNRHLQEADELVPLMEMVRREGNRGFVVIAPTVSGAALNLLVSNKTRGVLPTLAIKAPGLGSEKAEVLQDLAALTGGRVFFAESGESIGRATLADLGQAREVQAIRSGFTLIGGKGKPAAVRQRSHELRARIPHAPYGRERNRLIERAGKLQGGMALLEIGGATETERDYLKERTAEAVRAVRLGLQGGVVAGGGAALLRCIAALDSLPLRDEESPARTVMAQALTAPMTAIIENAGREPGPILAQVLCAGADIGYDVLSDRVLDVTAQNIVDPVEVLQAAVRTAVSGALMLMTTEALVHKPRSNRSEEVDFRP